MRFRTILIVGGIINVLLGINGAYNYSTLEFLSYINMFIGGLAIGIGLVLPLRPTNISPPPLRTQREIMELEELIKNLDKAIEELEAPAKEMFLRAYPSADWDDLSDEGKEVWIDRAWKQMNL